MENSKFVFKFDMQLNRLTGEDINSFLVSLSISNTHLEFVFSLSLRHYLQQQKQQQLYYTLTLPAFSKSY